MSMHGQARERPIRDAVSGDVFVLPIFVNDVGTKQLASPPICTDLTLVCKTFGPLRTVSREEERKKKSCLRR